MSSNKGSYAFLVSRTDDYYKVEHKKTLNDAKFYGFDYLYETEEPFYRFTKIPFPHLFYVSESYILYVVYARLKDDPIPYTVELTSFDKEIEEEVFPRFTDVTGLSFVYDPEARAKYRDRTTPDIRRTIRNRHADEFRRKNF